MNRLLKPILNISNALARAILRSRFHWLMSRSAVLLEITGRRSGNIYLVPVNYKTFNGGISVMTYRHRNWWKNLLDSDRIDIYLRGKRVVVRPEIVTDDIEAIQQGLLDRGWARRVTVRAKAEDSILIRLHLLN